eukprot:scaffold2435_cov92-Skeletonema_dohrnii-CCMP3373.AAC.8
MLLILTQTPHLSIVIGVPSTPTLFAGCVQDQLNSTAELQSQRGFGFELLASFFCLFPLFSPWGMKEGPSNASFQ